MNIHFGDKRVTLIINAKSTLEDAEYIDVSDIKIHHSSLDADFFKGKSYSSELYRGILFRHLAMSLRNSKLVDGCCGIHNVITIFDSIINNI